MSQVDDNEDLSRFELKVNGESAFAAYRRQGRLITFTHTVVPQALEGQGIGKRLIAGALKQVRSEGSKVIPVCSFVQHFIQTHPEEQDLLAPPA